MDCSKIWSSMRLSQCQNLKIDFNLFTIPFLLCIVSSVGVGGIFEEVDTVPADGTVW